VQLVRETPKGTKIRFNLSCAFHCPFEGVVPEAEALDWVERAQSLDADMEVAIADTTGNAAPDQVRRVFTHAINSWGNRFAFHGHDTYGMGLANMLAAWEAGCRVFDAGSGGIGGCPYAPGATGNTAMEDAVWMFERMGVSTGLDWQKLLAAAEMAAGIPGAMAGGRVRGVPAAQKGLAA
jgi:hydroxymethylglutaryl-CoA lyase